MYQTKHDHIYQDFRSKIETGRLLPGDSLPSHLDLMKEYGVALGTVGHAIGRLQGDGYVWSKRGLGSFVSDKSKKTPLQKTRQNIAFIAWERTVLIHHSERELFAVESYFGQHQIDVTIKTFFDAELNEAVEWASSFSGIILAGKIPIQFVELLAAKNIPVVVAGVLNNLPLTASLVNYDLKACMSMGFDFLRGLNHSKICLFIRSIGTDYFNAIETFFRESAKEVNLQNECSIIKMPPQNGSNIELLIKDLSVTPTAVIIEGGQFACSLIPAIRTHFPNMSIMALNSKPRELLTVTDLSQIYMDSEAMFKSASDVLYQMITQKRSVQVHLCPRLIMGSTCNNLHPFQ
jgi:DNA-binding LacI/PurR family transcriptional regulator